VEELEAHLHPQAQLRLINSLKQFEDKGTQFILTTHSTTLASNIPLDNLILCLEGKLYSMAKGQTGLADDDYEFLERFLDATKSNLFFAKGVIIVEGDAENIIIPTFARLLKKPLHRYGVSIVKVGSKALLRYAKIFQRKNNTTLPIKIAVVTDLDIAQISPDENEVKFKRKKDTGQQPDKDQEIMKLMKEFNIGNIQVFHSPLWTMEYDLANGCLAQILNQATYISQLIQSRTKHQSFRWVTEKEVVQRIKKADQIFDAWKSSRYSDEYIAFLIYKRLLDEKASKAVNAQWMSKIMLGKLEYFKKILEKDSYVAYIREAIDYVTRQ